MSGPIAITVGEPAGIGPDILIKLVTQHHFTQPLVLIANRDLLETRSKQMGIACTLVESHRDKKAAISLIDMPLNKRCTAGKADVHNSNFVLNALNMAASGCLSGEFSAMVTAPVNKAIIQQSGVNFSGHTGYLQKITQAKQALMLFAYGKTYLALLTTHIPLSEVVEHITAKNIENALKLLDDSFKQTFKIAKPRLLITGLNPHAGEQGCVGNEESEIIEPVIRKLQQQGMSVIGPIAADTAFKAAEKHQVDVIVSLYHDQLLPVIKTLGFGDIVNITLGLPIIRTSVDHGTAFDIAGSGTAEEKSLVNATRLAIQLADTKS